MYCLGICEALYICGFESCLYVLIYTVLLLGLRILKSVTVSQVK